MEDDDNVVSVDIQELLKRTRQQRNDALDKLEMSETMVAQLKNERAELRAKVKELESGGFNGPSDSSE